MKLIPPYEILQNLAVRPVVYKAYSMNEKRMATQKWSSREIFAANREKG